MVWFHCTLVKLTKPPSHAVTREPRPPIVKRAKFMCLVRTKLQMSVYFKLTIPPTKENECLFKADKTAPLWLCSSFFPPEQVRWAVRWASPLGFTGSFTAPFIYTSESDLADQFIPGVNEEPQNLLFKTYWLRKNNSVLLARTMLISSEREFAS